MGNKCTTQNRTCLFCGHCQIKKNIKNNNSEEFKADYPYELTEEQSRKLQRIQEVIDCSHIRVSNTGRYSFPEYYPVPVHPSQDLIEYFDETYQPDSHGHIFIDTRYNPKWKCNPGKGPYFISVTNNTLVGYGYQPGVALKEEGLHVDNIYGWSDPATNLMNEYVVGPSEKGPSKSKWKPGEPTHKYNIENTRYNEKPSIIRSKLSKGPSEYKKVNSDPHQFDREWNSRRKTYNRLYPLPGHCHLCRKPLRGGQRKFHKQCLEEAKSDYNERERRVRRGRHFNLGTEKYNGFGFKVGLFNHMRKHRKLSVSRTEYEKLLSQCKWSNQDESKNTKEWKKSFVKDRVPYQTICEECGGGIVDASRHEWYPEDIPQPLTQREERVCPECGLVVGESKPFARVPTYRVRVPVTYLGVLIGYNRVPIPESTPNPLLSARLACSNIIKQVKGVVSI